ncbi:hypothetical protein HanRHA438_Chr10g0438571 [Helianthus annuus]|nr:hypothetical protein HanRHA438_Chr10g0438571 [Helianthus annuus]
MSPKPLEKKSTPHSRQHNHRTTTTTAPNLTATTAFQVCNHISCFISLYKR